ncbi:MAG: hypothetical protein ACXW1Z_25620, partial [Methylobacter sp.]
KFPAKVQNRSAGFACMDAGGRAPTVGASRRRRSSCRGAEASPALQAELALQNTGSITYMLGFYVTRKPYFEKIASFLLTIVF